ncbi:Protein phosphatase PHLPP-like protein, partial [Stegodyphus mimosarum]
MTNISSQIAKAPKLKKLYLHSNLIANIPKLSDSPNLKILDLACNKLQQLELASIVPKGLTYLDLSANSDLQIDPTDFQHLCCQRSVAVVDVNCAGRQAPLSDSALKETENLSPWILGFTESQDGNTRLYIEFQKDAVSGRQEALIALMEVEDPEEVSQLRSVLPDLLKAERENKET